MSRFAIIDLDKCQPSVCGHLCQKFCPRVLSGDETVKFENGFPVINEDLCIGCGICVRKCPVGAIDIINTPEELEDPIHQYGVNSFRLFGLPVPQFGSVVSIVGVNGIGKTTAVKILSGELKPNLGTLDSDTAWKDIVSEFAGQELQNYLEKLGNGEIKALYKPQYIEQIPKLFSGSVAELLKLDEKDGLIGSLSLGSCLEKEVGSLSGGELQKVACAACISKEADLYMFDEPSAYLDVRERLALASVIRSLASEGKAVIVVEHDLVVSDYLADYAHIIYGKPRAYGVVSKLYSSKAGINIYLNGFLPEENIRFRKDAIVFRKREVSRILEQEVLLEYPVLKRSFKDFCLDILAGRIHKREVLGVLGANATGKTTFVKILAGVIKADNEFRTSLKVSYKPQYLTPDGRLVSKVLGSAGFSEHAASFQALSIDELMERPLDSLSGGELQRVAIAECISRDADLYLLDEPSAYLDVEQRIQTAKVICDHMARRDKTAVVVDHDLLFIDYVSSRLIIFEGEPGRHGIANPSEEMVSGMDRFLKGLGITFRKDPDTLRPRANKKGSVKDREQKMSGSYYYV